MMFMMPMRRPASQSKLTHATPQRTGAVKELEIGRSSKSFEKSRNHPPCPGEPYAAPANAANLSNRVVVACRVARLPPIETLLEGGAGDAVKRFRPRRQRDDRELVLLAALVVPRGLDHAGRPL